MLTDSWLNRWRSLAVIHAGEGPMLEMGQGDDTAALVGAGLVVASFSLHDIGWEEPLFIV
ncbi:hypothetical protein [Polaromonas sp. UC242_47]|uniref:hypothetical protein n=1 Tax=Polaromonas sp. UC242_47 TaxID=3374626 RepID=UPI0037BD54C3